VRGDNEPDIVEAIESWHPQRFCDSNRSLGSTVDDMTAKAAAKAAGRRLSER
jgi:molybdopterin-biosynthesis enzyme MoeA-like protein